ncbi:hypothetical protein HDZ31DRAFT_65826 [Schizophyllum fasciatum]
MSSATSQRSSRHKRQRPSKNRDDEPREPYTARPRTPDARSLSADTRTDSHPRMYHAPSHDDGYRAPKRGRYEPSDSPSSSRWRQPPEDDGYGYNRDDYRSRGRDDYPMKEADFHGSRYPPPARGGWYGDYAQGPSSPPASAREPWPVPAADPVYDEAYGWSPDVSQSRRSDDRRDGDGWRRKTRKDEGGEKKYTSDAGWDTRRKAREEQKRSDEDRDRMWEPAPGWKSAHNGELYEERLRTQGMEPKLGKHKNKGKKHKQKRARDSGGGGGAGDDDDFNNKQQTISPATTAQHIISLQEQQPKSKPDTQRQPQCASPSNA